MSTRDTRREFEEIIGRLAAEDPGIARPVRMITRRVQIIILAVIGALVWAGLSVLMVVWGAAGVAVTCAAVLVTVGLGVWFTRRRDRA
ncbi:DUF3040 domain-containing protein [Actinoplanes derwentensis]|uniref:DUF3040 domain-containing protein n=1 Tax=Actinoplanes derwentensis TaxID=113562 RepID=A0A1H1Z2E2_9ACTN|nr:DUF3040 domain-containing protein [Actinoplanes derwentensis]GID81393.1 hypothetical protein Ade03nite_03170 [Actinoplanes derwentensis]SDT27722.1 Protein of unknown function [Actinoplanes derwentensis]